MLDFLFFNNNKLTLNPIRLSKIKEMKKHLIFIVCLLFFTVAAYSQKNSLRVGISTFNHFEGYGFTSSRFFHKPKLSVKGVLRSLTWLYERQLSNQNSILISFSTFSYGYQPRSRSAYKIGLFDRTFGNVSIMYDKKASSFCKDRIRLSGFVGTDFRFGSSSYFVGFRHPGLIEPAFYPASLNNLGALIGANTSVKISKQLFIDVRSSYTYYFLGKDLWKPLGEFKRNRQVLSATLSLGYRF